MNIVAKLKKVFGKDPLDPLEEIQRVNTRILACPHYSCAIPGQIFCAAKQKFVSLDMCANCRREG